MEPEALHNDAEKYLDYSAYIRSLEEAERAHNLDSTGVLDALGSASEICGRAAEWHHNRGDAYVMAKAHYCAEIKRRVGLPRIVAGRPLPPGRKGTDKGGLREWCRQNGQFPTTIRRFASIAEATNPTKALAEYREFHRSAGNRSRKKIRALANIGREVERAPAGDALRNIKREWYRLSPVQRQAFMQWVYSVTATDKEAAD